MASGYGDGKHEWNSRKLFNLAILVCLITLSVGCHTIKMKAVEADENGRAFACSSFKNFLPIVNKECANVSCELITMIYDDNFIVPDRLMTYMVFDPTFLLSMEISKQGELLAYVDDRVMPMQADDSFSVDGSEQAAIDNIETILNKLYPDYNKEIIMKRKAVPPGYWATYYYRLDKKMMNIFDLLYVQYDLINKRITSIQFFPYDVRLFWGCEAIGAGTPVRKRRLIDIHYSEG